MNAQLCLCDPIDNQFARIRRAHPDQNRILMRELLAVVDIEFSDSLDLVVDQTLDARQSQVEWHIRLSGPALTRNGPLDPCGDPLKELTNPKRGIPPNQEPEHR